jgi:hypothetical protein
MYTTNSWSEANALEQRCKSGARWFFWIAGLTVGTSLLALTGGGYAFFLSLGATQFIDGVAKGLSHEFGDTIRIVGLLADISIAGVFGLLGWFAYKRQLWAFLVGMAIFALDAMILLVFQVWISFIFHALVTFWIFRGYQAGRALAALERTPEGGIMPPAPPDFSQEAPAAAPATTLNLTGE